MPSPVELFQNGHLDDAVISATEAVRNNPLDIGARSILCEVLCFAGDLERADKQLEAAIQIDADSAVGVSLIRHLIRSEICRREVFEQGRVPEFLAQPTPAQQLRLKALVSLNNDDCESAAKLIAEAFEREPEMTGECNGKAFVGMRDLDDLLGPNIEVFTATGQYYWLTAEQIISLEFSEIEHLSDLLWRAAQIVTVGDVSGRVHVPALYHNSHASADENIRTGRSTDWIQKSETAPILGVGQRDWLFDEDVVAITEVKEITFKKQA
ncbi:MAG: type VI secretion system accessory protein TagJ [Fuerstiella sp.]